jgi:hypothetical protein
MRWTWLAVLALVAGCDGIDLEQLVRQHPARTRVATEPPGENCAQGGQAVLAGLDLNDNGQLDDSEVTSTEYVCATAIPDVLLRTRQVPPGDRCPLGGQVSHAGRDTNGDGILDDGEVTREVYGCTEADPVRARLSVLPAAPFSGGCRFDGTLVEAGADANRNGELESGELRAAVPVCINITRVLMRVRPEPAGAACATGGTAADVGEDRDGDGVLDAGEVSASAYVCQPSLTFDGDYVVDDAADLVALAPISRIRGRLRIQGGTLTEVELPGLVAVDGDLRVESAVALTRLELRGLRYVGGALFAGYNSQLETLVVGTGVEQAVWVGTDLVLITNAKLSTLTGLSYVSPRNNFVLNNNDALQAPGVLAYVQRLTGFVTIDENDLLRELPLHNLEEVGGLLTVAGNPSLTSLNGLGSLMSVGGDLTLHDNDALLNLAGLFVRKVGGTLDISRNDSLVATGELPVLRRVGGISINGNDSLETVSNMPVLELVEGDFSIGANRKLLGVEELRSLGYVGGRLSVSGSPLLTRLSGFGRLLRVRRLEVRDSDALVSLDDLAGLRDMEELVVQNNPSLSTLGLRELERVGARFVVTDNPSLPGCLATSLADAVYAGPPEQRDISRNAETPCGP